MALPSEIPRSFGLYVTYVDGEGHFLKISGQLDQQASLMIESLFETARENLESGLGAPTSAAIHEGIICAAKYKDGVYYRAKIINTTRLSNGLVGVHFIDYGNKDNISLSAIRLLDKYDPMFLKLRGQATDYYLSRVMNPSGIWEERLLLKLQSLICYTEYPGTIDAQTRTLPFISLVFNGTDLSTHLVSIRLGIAIPLPKQEALLLQMLGENPPNANWQPNFNMESSGFPEHVPFLNNQNFPFNPASAMRQQAAVPFNGSVPPPSLIYQRLQANRVSRNPVNLKPARQPQLAAPPFQESMPPSTPPVIHSVGDQKPNNSLLKSPKKSITYKSRLLEVNSEHQVFVSYAEEGPELFAVQLVADANKLQNMMDEINKRPHSSLKEPPMIGTVCLGRMSGDRVICRAIVMNLSGSQCKLFFVDFGDTEMVSYYDIFDIPEEFVKPNVFAMRFCLSGVKKLEKGPHLNETFKQLACGKMLKLRVVSPEGPPLIQYGELYLDDKNLFELIMANMKDKLQFKWIEMLPLGSKQSVLVSYVDSCIKFYVQLSDKIDELNSVMEAVRVHCEKTSSPGELPVGAPCCARFPDDEKWYRARVRSTNGDRVVVTYVDYGNEQEIRVSDLRTINPELIKLPAQAIKCALKGFENKPVETKTSNQLEMLALEKTLMAHIVGVLSSDTMLVTLVDDTVSPPLDVARKMNQLSQPRSSQEVKVTTPIWKDTPESFSSPESNSDDGRKKNFRREKSFKDDRRQKEGGEEFSPRGGSFRGRDNKEGFDRSAPARHSEKFTPRQERGDRRGGSKPWENNATSPPHASNDDDWAENPSHSAYQQPPNRGPRDANRDRRKPRAEHQDRGQKGWRGKETGGVGKRLRQAVEAASESAQRTSVQDRLKRDYKSNHEDREEWKEDWGNRTGGRPDRPDRRDNRTDNRGDRRDNRGERRDNRKEWNDRPKSNFSPRDRAERVERPDRSERSYGSECDRYSERSNRSQDNSRAGRAPPYKPRSKFTQVQYKELPNPIPLTTPFSEPTVEPGSQHEVSVTWIISPESFYTQILSLQAKFLEMMQNIPELYKGVKSYTGEVPVGATVLARYPVDGVLYRATVVAVQPFSKFIVRYVDFGNKQLVDAKDIWQVDNSLMELPKMAVHCSLIGVMPKDEAWKADAEIDLCFNAPRYQCIFQENVDGQYKVSLWNNGVSVTDMLVEKQLAKLSDHQSSVTLKDEAIDLTIIVGQQILCRVTHVESFEKFYVQLDLEKSALVEKAIANFDTSNLTPLIADNLIDGIHCTVKHNDKIYRAILEDVSDPANITAVLPDFGYSITTSLEHLMILPNELSVYYYQSLQCCLNNYTPESKTLMSVEELKSRLTGNKFIIYINNVEEIRLVSTLYDSVTGKKVAIFEPDEGAYDEVVQLCTRSVFNYSFGLAYIAHVENLNEIYLQKSSDGDRIAELLDEMYKFYEEGSSEPLTTFEVDGLCAAKSSDSNWYRATIITVEETQVKVQFPDYGNTETIPKESLKKLDTKFYEPCALALVASLSLVALQDNAISKLIEWTTEKEVQVTLAFGTDEWLASLHLDGVDLAMKLVNEKLATPQLISNEEQHEKAETPVEEPISLPEGCTQVYISHIDTPGHFWLQMLDKVEKIEAIQAELQTNANFYPDIENREMGTWCAAKYLADDQWYRAEILDSDSDITTVRFIDYGNTDVLDNQPGLIKELPEHMKQIERFAIKSSVNAVPTGTGQWSEPASDYFTQLVGDLSAPVDVLIVLKDVTTYVDIFVNGQNLTDKLVTEGHAARSEEAECGDLPSCFASHVNSPSEFWIQLETAAPELQAMEAAMIDAENFPVLEEKEEGVICAAKYPEDDAWYRAQVIVDGSEGTEVLFMDYGNASIANELRNLPDELKVKPALSRKCALQKPRDVKSWSRKSEIKFNELAAEGATIFKVQFIASGDISIVDLYLDGKSVTEELVGLCEEVPISGRPTPVGQDLRNNGKICFVNSVEEFYVQLEDSDDELDKVLDRMAGAPEFEPITELKVGSLCAALWCDDEQWYRAKVLEFCDVGYHLQFIDYGNKAKCEEFRQLPEDLIHIEPLAKCCRLAGFPLDIDMQKNGRNKLDDYAAEVTNFEIEFLDTTKEPLLVKMFVDGKDIVSIITSENVNTITENKSSENFEPEISNGTVHKSESVEEITNNLLQDLETSKRNVIINDSIANNNVEHRLEENVENNGIEEKLRENKSKQSEITVATENVGDDLNASQKEELDESFESNHTVIENKSFDSKDNLSDASLDEGIKEDVPMSPDQNISSDTFEYSNETEGSLKLEKSKDSITDTGFTSCSEQDKVKGFELDEESQENRTHEKDTQKKEAESKEKDDDKLVKETNAKQIQETESENKSIQEKSVEENMAEPESQVSQEKIEEVESPIDTSKTECPIITEDFLKKQEVNEVNSKEEIVNKTE